MLERVLSLINLIILSTFSDLNAIVWYIIKGKLLVKGCL